MSTLKLITTENFNNLSCNFYRNMNDDILLTRDQIGQALEYADPIKAIQNIHAKHKDRLDQMSIKIKTETFDTHQSEVGRNKNLITERVYYTEKGIMEICRWSRQPKANLFMDWVWDIISKYRHNELTPTIPDLQPLIDSIAVLTQTVTTIQQDISSLKESSKKKQLPITPFSRWKKNTFDKLKLLTKYVNDHSDQNLELKDTMHIVLNEVQDTYDIDLVDYTREYVLENSLDTKPYDLDVVSYYKDLKDMYTLTLNSILEKLNIQLPSTKRNIFDELAEQI